MVRFLWKNSDRSIVDAREREVRDLAKVGALSLNWRAFAREVRHGASRGAARRAHAWSARATAKRKPFASDSLATTTM